MAWRASIGRNIQSIKVMACPKGASSAAARSFWDKNYNLVKDMNPTFPFMLRQAPEMEPYLVVEYDFARKVKVPLSGMDEAAIEKKFEEAVEIGEKMPRNMDGPGRLLPSVVE